MMKIFLFIVMMAVLTGNCLAATFDADPGEIKAAIDKKTGEVSITWVGIGKIAVVEQYLTHKVDGKWILRHKVENRPVTINGFRGDRFNLVDESGRYLMLTPEMAAAKLKPFKLEGISIDCSNPDGCALQLAPGK